MEFIIFNRYLIQTCQFEIPSILISITEPRYYFPPINRNPNLLSILKLKYSDEDEEKNIESFGKKKILFSDFQANQILDFVFYYKDKVRLIICQCDGGMSRSSATAASLSVILNGLRTDNWIFKSYIPNMLVYRKILEQFTIRKENLCSNQSNSQT